MGSRQSPRHLPPSPPPPPLPLEAAHISFKMPRAFNLNYLFIVNINPPIRMFLLLVFAHVWPQPMNPMQRKSVSCPVNCLCVDSSVVCSCEDALGGSYGKEFKLPNFGGIQFIDSLVIHSCDKVMIPNDTFSGIVILNIIKIIAVKNLEISPWAFRGLRRAPEQLIVQATAIPYCPPHAFSELTNVKHIWFRNSTIGTLATEAFSGIRSIDYVYFRDSIIELIQDAAFGFMHGIQHFFVRGNVTIQSAGSGLFLNSTIDEVIFQEVQFTAPSDCFVGLEATNVQVLSSSWKSVQNSALPENLPRVSGLPKKLPKNFLEFYGKIGRFSIINSTLDLIAVGMFQNTNILHISHSTICNIVSSGTATGEQFDDSSGNRSIQSAMKIKQDPEMVPGIRRIEFSESTIKVIEAGAFRDIREFKTLKVSRCRIAAIEGDAFRNSQFNRIQIHRTHIDKLFADAFAALFVVDLFFWDECDIGLIEGATFRGANIQALRFSRCHITKTMMSGFSGLETDHFVLEKTKIYRCGDMAFSSSKIRNLTVTGTEILSGAFGDVFRNLRVTYFQVRNNLFDCDVMHCDTNGLLTGEQTSWDLPWYFRGNRCLKRKICRQPPEWSFRGVICKSYRFVAQCICTNPAYANAPDINASVLIIGDCGILEVDLVRNENITSLYIFRTEALKIGKVPKNLQILEIFHSTVISVSRGAFASGLRMEKIEAISTQFEVLARESFVNFQLLLFVLRSSTLSYVDPRAFRNSSVSELRAEKCNFLRISNFWHTFDKVTLTQAFVNLPKFLLKEAQILCMKEVVVACDCLVKELGYRNDCGQVAPICSRRQYAVGCSMEKEKFISSSKPSVFKSERVLIFIVFISVHSCFRPCFF